MRNVLFPKATHLASPTADATGVIPSLNCIPCGHKEQV